MYKSRIWYFAEIIADEVITQSKLQNHDWMKNDTDRKHAIDIRKVQQVDYCFTYI